MAQNKNALIRYRTIDKCLQNSYRTWTLDDLIEACSEALYEYEGRDVNVSRRTVQLDIQLMRGDKLGYNAPIEVYDKKYYRYEDPDYSITDIPLNESDMHVLSESVEMLRQFKDFSLFSELGGIIQRLEDKIYAEKTHRPAIIHLDKNEQLKGLEHLDTLYQAILKRVVLKITYRSFTARTSSVVTFHPFILKEFNNRWFLVGKKGARGNVMTLALDRIEAIDYDLKTTYLDQEFDGDAYYKNTIGVTVMDEKFVDRIVLRVASSNAPYVLTKPLHHSQKLLERLKDGAVLIELFVHTNYELERLILGFGESMQVLEPASLQRRILAHFQGGLDMYRTMLSVQGMVAAKRKLQKNGYAIINDVYTRKEVRKILSELTSYFEHKDEPAYGKRTLIRDVPVLRPLLLNENLLKIVRTVDPEAFLTKAIYFDKPQKANWYVAWHQDVPINVRQKMEVDGYVSWTYKKGIHSVCPPDEVLEQSFTIRIHLDDTGAHNGGLQVVPGSFKRRLSDVEIATITENSNPALMEVQEGGIQLMKPLLLHASSRSKSQKRRRVIHLEFSSHKLDGGLEWLEREVF